MNEFYFAGYRLLADDNIAGECAARLARFIAPLPYTHTFTVREGDESKRDAYFARAEQAEVLLRCDIFDVLRLKEGTAIYHKSKGPLTGTLVICSGDYGEMTTYISRGTYTGRGCSELLEKVFPFEYTLRHALETGIALRGGIPAHAAMVDREGKGILFLGPSGMGKSTQARLWEKHLGAEILSGDRPCLRKSETGWRGYGMPWDGKDCILRQSSVPLRAAVVLEQAEENEIRPMSPVQAMAVLLKQVSIPTWDRRVADTVLQRMSEVARDIPFWHLKNRADEDCARLTLNTILEKSV